MRYKPYTFDFTLSDIKEHQMLPHNAEIEKSVLGYFFFHVNDFPIFYKYLKQKGIFYDEIHNKILMLLLNFTKRD